MSGMLTLVLSMVFTGAIIWASRKLVSLINHKTVCTTLIQWNIPLGQNGTGCAILPQGRGKMVHLHIFTFSPYLKNINIYDYISWSNTCIDIVWRFLPNIMIIGWIFLTWDQFFLSYAVLPRLPLYVVGFNELTDKRSHGCNSSSLMTVSYQPASTTEHLKTSPKQPLGACRISCCDDVYSTRLETHSSAVFACIT